MTKLITSEMLINNPNKFLSAIDFVDRPQQLKIVKMEETPDEWQGELHTAMTFTFEIPRTGEVKQIKDKFWQLFQAIKRLDPDEGDIILLVSGFYIGNNGKKYYNWQAEIVQKSDATNPAPIPKKEPEKVSAFDENGDVKIGNDEAPF